MTETYTVTVSSFQEIQDRMQKLGDEAEGMIQNAMYVALNGDVRTKILHETTPMSTTSRYGKYYDKNGKEIKKKFKERSVAKQKASGQSGTLRKSFRVDKKGSDEVTIGHSAPYAAYVHEAKKPLPGDYWEPGKKGGWTTKGTGPKYVSSVLEEYADKIPEFAVKDLDRRLQEKRII